MKGSDHADVIKSLTIDTACSSTLIAVDMACRYLQCDQADGVLVGGTLIYLEPIATQDRGPMGEAYSKSGKCHTFDAKADGYMRAEGVNVVYLKRLDDALRDGDPIRAVIRGSAVNSDGHTPSLTSPNSISQAAAIRAAYKNANIGNFNETGYLECHGTGTPTGDPIEVAGVTSVFAPFRDPKSPLFIGSIKGNIGHSEAAAGLSGLMKAAMVVERGIIPGNPMFITPNPRIDFENSGVRVPRVSIRWPSRLPLRRASVNSFGFGGANAHVVLESVESFLGKYQKNFVSSYVDSANLKYHKSDIYTLSERPYLLLFSANDRTSLKKNVAATSNHLINPAVNAKLSDIAHTLSEKRTHHFHRAFITTRSFEFLPGSETTGKVRLRPPRIGFVFTGQGAQWSQMGKDLINTFPLVKHVIESLQESLDSLPCPPEWSLLAELSEKRDPILLRSPEFSQPLVTALQIAMVEVLCSWGIKPKRVVGHSSGEIAAAVAAGIVSPKEAIRIAFLRGKAAKLLAPKQSMGMLAVGASMDDIAKYLEPSVHIACFNSPNSLTLSGPIPALEVVRDRLKEDNIFARLLHVDLAYHSEYMKPIGERYIRLLLEHCPAPSMYDEKVLMYSSVTGQSLPQNQSIGPDYWLLNMVSPVRFAQAASDMLSGEEGSEFLVEIGPSNSLSAPITQILKSFPEGKSQVQYMSAAKRGENSSNSILEVPGRLWACGAHVNLSAVNDYRDPSFIVDLPNYQWNHTSQHWWEDLATKELRYKKFVSHDLLGSKIPGISWENPSWSKLIDLNYLPWLRDHEVIDQVVFPGAGYLAMAMEAIYQTMMITQWNSKAPDNFYYKLSDIKFHRGLVLGEVSGTRLDLDLAILHASPTPWYTFKIKSYTNEVWTLHCSGLIRVEEDFHGMSAPAEAFEPLQYPELSIQSYKYTMKDAGYVYGPSFQRIIDYEWRWGEPRTRARLSMEEPVSNWKQSFYPIHPVSMDSFFQLSGFPIKQLLRTINDNSVLMPATIDSLVVASRESHSAQCPVVVDATDLRIDSKLSNKNFSISGGIYDPADKSTLLRMKGLRYNMLESRATRATDHVYTRFAWDADISLISETNLIKRLEDGHTDLSVANGFSSDSISIHKILNLVAHKKPTLKVLEIHAESGPSSYLWLGDRSLHSTVRGGFSRYHCISNKAKDIFEMQELHSGSRHVTFELRDVVSEGIDKHGDFDFAIMELPELLSRENFETLLFNIRRLLQSQGQLLLVGLDGSIDSANGEHLLGSLEFSHIIRVPLSLGRSAILCELGWKELPKLKEISFLQFSPICDAHLIITGLKELGLTIRVRGNSTREIEPKSAVVVLDELFGTVISRLDSHQWSMLRDLVEKECKILWVTAGAQLEVTEPERAATHGFFRVIRNEGPHLRILTLDVEQPTGHATVRAICDALKVLVSSRGKFRNESEFVERKGVLHTSRLVPDERINEAKFEHVNGREPQHMDIYKKDTYIRLYAERLGTLDSLRWNEVSTTELPLDDNFIEVDVYASGINFKEVAIVMGVVPGDSYGIGGEGSGIVTRVGAKVPSTFKPGQRIVWMYSATYANRAQTPYQVAYPIPDTMSFEEAASLPVAYLTTIYSLFDMANLKKDQKVLVHSATGGVGNSAIQICRYMEAEVSISIINII